MGTFGWVRRAGVRRLQACGQRGRPRWRVKLDAELPVACIMLGVVRTGILLLKALVSFSSFRSLISHTGSL